MSENKMSPELQVAIRRSPEYTQPSAELVALRAEVAAWRGAVRWRESSYRQWKLCVSGQCVAIVYKTSLWRAKVADPRSLDLVAAVMATDRNTACAKVCELLGLPVVLP
jgi:hypothetical protein